MSKEKDGGNVDSIVKAKVVVDGTTEDVSQRLSLQEFTKRNTKLNLLLVGVIQMLHGKEKHTEVEWMRLYSTIGSRQTK